MKNMKWIAPKASKPAWHYVDEDGNILGEVFFGTLGWTYIARKGALVIAQGSGEKSPVIAQQRVEEALRD